MKQYILLLVLMVMGAGMTVHAEDVNPVKVGNVISGHIIEKGTEASLPYATILIVETGQGTVSERMESLFLRKSRQENIRCVCNCWATRLRRRK